MTILVTGAAGFIGSHVSHALLVRGESVIGIDNLNAYYDLQLKRARLERLQRHANFRNENIDISDKEAVFALAASHPQITGIVHLAAQAGVRYSLINPFAYIQSNLMGHTVMVEAARTLPRLEHFVYASSSSVYGANTEMPFSVGDRVDKPNSLYAATKRSGELISYTYSHLYKLPQTGLRYFTVYGPWGRPDMAPYIFASRISAGAPIEVFNNGEMWRDFTYIDDVIDGTLAALDRPPTEGVPHRVYNIGNSRSEKLTDFIAELENALGRKAVIHFKPLQMGDVPSTYADIAASQRDLGYNPRTSISDGVPRFVAWYRSYYGG